MYGFKRTVQPTTRPITVAEALAHVKADSNDEESWFEAAIDAAREWIEDNCNRTLLTTTWAMTLDEFPGCIVLPRPPVQSVTSIVYTDSEGASQTLDAADYVVDTGNPLRCRVVPAYGETWPDTRDQIASVVVTYVAGETLVSNLSPRVRHAMKLLVGHFYENREATLTGTISKEVEFSVTALLAASNITTVG